MYFTDSRGLAKMSSYNCKDVELTDAYPDDLEPAVNVPGKSRGDVEELSKAGDLSWPNDDTVKADFDGLYDGKKMLVKWRTRRTTLSADRANRRNCTIRSLHK